jgi:hypothetical protein
MSPPAKLARPVQPAIFPSVVDHHAVPPSAEALASALGSAPDVVAVLTPARIGMAS